jgi:hypothetical protein
MTSAVMADYAAALKLTGAGVASSGVAAHHPRRGVITVTIKLRFHNPVEVLSAARLTGAFAVSLLINAMMQATSGRGSPLWLGTST